MIFDLKSKSSDQGEDIPRHKAHLTHKTKHDLAPNECQSAPIKKHNINFSYPFRSKFSKKTKKILIFKDYFSIKYYTEFELFSVYLLLREFVARYDRI